MSKRSYTIEPYNSEWPTQFNIIKTLLSEVFTHATAIEHVGSTSIPGTKAKPLIDVLVIVPNIDLCNEEKKKMEEMGYESKANYLAPRSLLFEKVAGDRKIENIHVFEPGAPNVSQFLDKRDYFRTHQEKVREYEALKEKLYKQFPDDYSSYRAGKIHFLNVEIEKLAQEWKANNKN